MNTFHVAVWANSSFHGTKDQRAEFHINVWGGTGIEFIDIGLMFPVPTKDTKIYFYIPEPLGDAVAINDLGKRLVADKQLRSALFNEVMQEKSCPHNFMDKILATDSKNESFCIYPISEEQFAKEQKWVGTVIEISKFKDCTSNKTCNKMYIRFRIEGKFINSFFVKDELAASKLQNFTSSISFFDFRLNETRTLDPGLVENMYNNEKITFKLIQYFLLSRSEEELVLSKTSTYNIRCLESSIWDKYLPSNANDSFIKLSKDILRKIPWIRDWNIVKEKKDILIAYHWKEYEKYEDIEDFTLLTKLKSTSLSSKKIILLIFVTITLGVIPSIVGSYLWDMIKQNY